MPEGAGSKTFESLGALARDLSNARDLASVYAHLKAFIESEAPISGIFISRYEPKSELRTCVYAMSEGEELDVSTFPPMPNTGSPHSRAIESGETIVTHDFQEAMAGKPRMNVGLERDPRLPQSSIVVPMKTRGAVLGAIEIQSTVPHAFDEPHVALLRLAAHLTALAIESVEATSDAARLKASWEDRVAELEEKMRERMKELASKNRELEAFSFTAAHDLRAPLRAILNLSEALVEREASALSERARGDLGAIHESSVRMANLVENLLRFARTAQGGVKREMVDMTTLARAILADFQAREPDRQADVHVQDNLFVEADPSLVRILLDNLIGNAWKYSAKKPATVVRVGARLEGGDIVYFVEDRGIGFDAAHAQRIFLAFERLAPNEYEGTGLGLATAQRIVHRHGGRILAKGRAGEGAIFEFTLAPARPVGGAET